MAAARAVAAAALLAATVTGCGPGTGPVPGGSAPPGGTGLTGLGASTAVWDAHHGGGYSAVVTDAAGRVEGYLLVVAAVPLADAQRLVGRDLPDDARAGAPQLVHGVEGTVCEIVEFTSPTLGRVLGGTGGGRVTATFQTAAAIVMDPARITHVLVASGNEGLPRQC